MADQAVPQPQKIGLSVHEQLLTADFGQCFQHLRYYEETMRKILEFAIGLYIAVLAAYAAIVGKYGGTPLVEVGAGVLLGTSVIAGLMLLAALARNRVYFTLMCRYVNEVRAAYLAAIPAGITNRAGIYSDSNFPMMGDRGSIHAVILYFICLCNAAMFGTYAGTMQMAWKRMEDPTLPVIDLWHFSVAFLALFVAQLFMVFHYWHRKETLPASQAADGRGEI